MDIEINIQELQSRLSLIEQRKNIVYDVIAAGNDALGQGRRIIANYEELYSDSFVLHFFEQIFPLFLLFAEHADVVIKLRVLMDEFRVKIRSFNQRYCDMAGKLIDENNSGFVSKRLEKICKSVTKFYSVSGCKRKINKAVDVIYSVIENCESMLEQLESDRITVQAKIDSLSKRVK